MNNNIQNENGNAKCVLDEKPKLVHYEKKRIDDKKKIKFERIQNHFHILYFFHNRKNPQKEKFSEKKNEMKYIILCTIHVKKRNKKKKEK